MGAVDRYWLVFKMATLDIFEYRFDFFANATKYAFMVSMMAFIWNVVQQSSPVPPVMSLSQTITYFLLAATIYSFSNFHTTYVEADIRLGGLTKYLTKPLNPFRYYLVLQAAPIVVETLIKTVLFLVIIWKWQSFAWPGLAEISLFFVFLPLIYFFTFSLYFSISSLSFWIQDAFAIRWGLIIIFRFLSGLLVPISLLPIWAQGVSFWGPFQHLAYTPIQLLQHQVSLNYAVQGWLILAGWTVVMSLVRVLTWRTGLQEFEGSGL